jgi:hypothetical protein
MTNKYYQLFLKIWGTERPDGLMSMDAVRAYTRNMGLRFRLNQRYSWAVPTPVVTAQIKEFTPQGICEIGAGSGYWLGLLKDMGIDTVGYDDQSSHLEDRHRGRWHPLIKGGAEKAGHHKNKALFLCWPPYNTPMAHEALKAYRGDRLVYIGEGYGGCTGDDDFHDLLEKEWEVEYYPVIPQWPGIHDSLHLCRRN